ncbi:MAG TPA: orotidine-5'-phosphate decarboxylase [Gammaproteobacteria bacterium]|nr:orotidine-5'-phosphate decarboxylase [Gammaproteobacteria bacterium]MDP6733645.1 orotidine-5'-phosphate decarboxylase [Gammaproteobacteria bacterium]HAJ75497.1 orotidine-5'-phosphate decarboxylase [Gammaproteobacteria bacterium]
MTKRIIIALDFDTALQAKNLLAQLDPSLCRVKIGKELFTASGPKLVREVISSGFDVFLDLKFHDIPNTVARAVKVAADLGVWMLNVHASGGLTMMEQARLALEDMDSRRPLLIGVTVLTSMGKEDLQQIGIVSNPEEQVSKLAFLSRDAGLDGVVCSAAETHLLRAQLPDDFCLVTPGIRRAEDAAEDQKRIVGPAEAIQNGSNYLVVGRPITRAESPNDALIEFNSVVAGVS